jgi:hypothetical protein
MLPVVKAADRRRNRDQQKPRRATILCLGGSDYLSCWVARRGGRRLQKAPALASHPEGGDDGAGVNTVSPMIQRVSERTSPVLGELCESGRDHPRLAIGGFPHSNCLWV